MEEFRLEWCALLLGGKWMNKLRKWNLCTFQSSWPRNCIHYLVLLFKRCLILAWHLIAANKLCSQPKVKMRRILNYYQMLDESLCRIPSIIKIIGKDFCSLVYFVGGFRNLQNILMFCNFGSSMFCTTTVHCSMFSV